MGHQAVSIFLAKSTRFPALEPSAPDERTASQDLLTGLYHKRGQGVQGEAEGALCC